ncbi:MAG: tetratricopeptide repeat protein [Aureispira sp.]
MLSPKEIDSIKALLLSSDSNNVLLATTLLQEQAAAIQALIIPLDLALTFSDQKEAVVQLLQAHRTVVAWRQLPLFAFYTAIAEPQIQAEHHPIIRRFLQFELAYRPYLLEETKKALLYVDGANFISGAAAFVETAHTFYALALEQVPEDSYLYYKYADLLRRHPLKGQSSSTTQSTIVRYYKKAYQLKKERHILGRLANFYAHDLKTIPPARQMWQWCLQEHPNYGEAWVALAKLEVGEERWSIAQKLLEKTLKLEAKGMWVDKDEVYHLLGMVSWKGEKDPTKASQYFEQALDENRYFAAPLEALLQLSLDHKNHQQGIRWHRHALELQPMNLFLLLQLAQLYLETENYEKAAATYREILTFTPNYRPALEGLAQLDGL